MEKSVAKDWPIVTVVVVLSFSTRKNSKDWIEEMTKKKVANVVENDLPFTLMSRCIHVTSLGNVYFTINTCIGHWLVKYRRLCYGHRWRVKSSVVTVCHSQQTPPSNLDGQWIHLTVPKRNTGGWLGSTHYSRARRTKNRGRETLYLFLFINYFRVENLVRVASRW